MYKQSSGFYKYGPISRTDLVFIKCMSDTCFLLARMVRLLFEFLFTFHD